MSDDARTDDELIESSADRIRTWRAEPSPKRGLLMEEIDDVLKLVDRLRAELDRHRVAGGAMADDILHTEPDDPNANEWRSVRGDAPAAAPEHNHLNRGVYGGCPACGTDWDADDTAFHPRTDDQQGAHRVWGLLDMDRDGAVEAGVRLAVPPEPGRELQEVVALAIGGAIGHLESLGYPVVLGASSVDVAAPAAAPTDGQAPADEPRYARIRVRTETAGMPGWAWPIVERVPGGWQSGAHHYPDADVEHVRPLALSAAPADDTAAPDVVASKARGLGRVQAMLDRLRPHLPGDLFGELSAAVYISDRPITAEDEQRAVEGLRAAAYASWPTGQEPVRDSQPEATAAPDPERAASEKRWNDAIDWLLNSRHCAEPGIQGPFWAHVDGQISLDDLQNEQWVMQADGSVAARPVRDGGEPK